MGSSPNVTGQRQFPAPQNISLKTHNILIWGIQSFDLVLTQIMSKRSRWNFPYGMAIYHDSHGLCKISPWSCRQNLIYKGLKFLNFQVRTFQFLLKQIPDYFWQQEMCHHFQQNELKNKFWFNAFTISLAIYQNFISFITFRISSVIYQYELNSIKIVPRIIIEVGKIWNTLVSWYPVIW